MEVTGLAVGVVGLAGLFSVCLDSLSRFQSYRESNSETHVLDTRFRAARARFEQWGVSVGISNGRLQPNHHDGLDNKHTVDLIESILQIIAKTICDESILQSTCTGPRLQSGPFGGLSQSRGKRLKWALGGKESRNEQVDIFEKLVQQLYHLIPPEDKDKHYEGLESKAWVEDIRQMLTKIEEGIKSKMQRDVLAWLGRSPPSDKYEDSLGKRVDTTCEWIFDRPTFKSWLSLEDSSKPNLLWINGPAGFGKTVLCAHIVHNLSEALDTLVAHFFFTSDHEGREDPFSALRSWQCHVAAKNNEAFQCIRRAWENDSSEKASRSVLIDLFKEIVKTVPGCVFIADGLDECSQLGNGDASVARFIRDIMGAIRGANVRLLLISRDEPEIREALEENKNMFSEYRIGTDDVEADTAAFSQSVVDKRLSNKSEDLRVAISEAMKDRCQGQFLWIKMQEQSLRNGMSKKRLHEVVENTPPGLDRLYDHNWNRIMDMPDWDRDRAFALLRWTAFMFTPPTVHAVIEAVLITQFEELDLDDYPENIDDDYIRTEIVGLCGPLLEVHDNPADPSPGYRKLHIPHFSVRQYLVEHLPAPAWMEANNILCREHEKIHQTIIARACVRYLSSPGVWEQDDYLAPFPRDLLSYAALTWIRHARLGLMDPSIIDLSSAFLKDRVRFKSLVNHLARQMVTSSLKASMFHPQLRPFEYVFYEGWIKMADHLIDDADVNEIGGYGRSPIFSACNSGSAESVNTLIRHGADLSITDDRGHTCLHVAAECGFEDIVRILVKSKVELSPQSHDGDTPLHLASARGRNKCCQYLIEGGADVKMKNKLGGSIVHSACLNAGRAELLRIILQNGPDTLATDHPDNLGSPLKLVTDTGDVEMAMVLFEHGATSSLFVPHSYGELPIHLAAYLGHNELLQLFLQRCAENTQSVSNMAGNTALHLVCDIIERDITIGILLRPGVEQSLLTENKFGDTPLHVASGAGNANYVMLILQYSEPDHQRLLEMRNRELETPLCLASSSGHVSVVRELLKYGAQTTLSISNRNNETPLLIASYNGHAEVVKTLLEHGAKPTLHLLDSYKCSPLWAASFMGHGEITNDLMYNPGSALVDTCSGELNVQTNRT